MGGVRTRRPDESWKHRGEIVSPIKAILELGQITRHVFLVDCAVCSALIFPSAVSKSSGDAAAARISVSVVRGITVSMCHLTPSRVNFRGVDVHLHWHGGRRMTLIAQMFTHRVVYLTTDRNARSTLRRQSAARTRWGRAASYGSPGAPTQMLSEAPAAAMRQGG
jgi:hypothetical protein